MNQEQIKKLGKVAVLMGGRSGERPVSIMSGTGVLNALKAKGVDAHAFDPSEKDLYQLKLENFDRCFIALHGRFGEDGTVQGALELMGIPYTGSGVMTSAIAIDKLMTKRVWITEGIPTPLHISIEYAKFDESKIDTIVETLGLPMIVKPAREGSSLGVTKALSKQAVLDAIHQAGNLDSDILCEQFIAGDEITCPILGTGDQAIALPPIRIVAPAGDYNFDAKYISDETQYHVPSGLPESEETIIKEWVLKAYKILGSRGWGRIDVMINGITRQPYLLELNTSPGMTSHSLVPMAAKATGISYEDLCLQLISEASLDYKKAAASTKATRK